MDRQTGDHHQVSVDVYEGRLRTGSFSDHDPAGNGQRPVEPGGEKHAAVFFHVGTDVGAGFLRFRVFLKAEDGAVAVGGGHEKPAPGAHGHPERDHGGAVARDVIAFAGLQGPGFRFGKRLESVPGQQGRYRFRNVEGTDASGNKLQKIFVNHKQHFLSSG